jgi:predicted transcriptional regulator
MDKRRLAEIENYIFEVFRNRRSNNLPTKEVFDASPQYANGDLVRAFEDLEKKQRLLIRYTEEGEDRVELTPEGVKRVGEAEFNVIEYSDVLPHPPRSSTG